MNLQNFFHSETVFIKKETQKLIAETVKNFWQYAQTKLKPEFLSAPIMSYDFHLDDDQPKLIEINTSAAGYVLTGKSGLFGVTSEEFIKKIIQIFETEAKGLKNIAIVDDKIKDQFFYEEFEILKNILEKAGFHIFILEPHEVEKYPQIQFIYWRHTDFLLQNFPQIKKKYQKGEMKLSPTPEIFSLLSDKSNMTRWDQSSLQSSQLSQVLLPTQLITTANAEELWADRKNWVFKPAALYGGKGVYLGKKLSKPKWDEIVTDGNYLAQAYVAPLEIDAKASDERVKADLRAYAWRDELLLLIARGYTGQITNFRSEGSGFYPIKIRD